MGRVLFGGLHYWKNVDLIKNLPEEGAGRDGVIKDFFVLLANELDGLWGSFALVRSAQAL